MMKRLYLLALGLVGCGAPARSAAAVPAHVQEAPASPTEVTPDVAERSSTPQAILDGRFQVVFPADISLTPSDDWTVEAHDAYEFASQGCAFTLIAQSEGLLRPAQPVPLEDGMERFYAPSEEAEARLEIVTSVSRVFDSAEGSHAAVGAVVFESDATATDIFVWPHLPEGAEVAAPNDGDELSAQRRHPHLSRCLEVARGVLRASLPSLVALRPFAPSLDTMGFGYDPNTESSSRFRGELPPGWIITATSFSDARPESLHQRQTWAWTSSPPSSEATVSWFTQAIGEEPSVEAGPRVHLFDYDLRFGRDGCAMVHEVVLGSHSSVCLSGTPAERRQLIAILQTFVRVRVPAPSGCSLRVADEDGGTNLRARPSSSGALLAVIPNDTEVFAVEVRGAWVHLEAPHAGWVFGEHLARRCTAAEP